MRRGRPRRARRRPPSASPRTRTSALRNVKCRCHGTDEIERIALRHPIEEETAAGLLWRISEAGETRTLLADVRPERRRRILQRTARWREEHPEIAAGLLDRGARDPESRAALALWDACRAAPLPPAPPAEPPLVERVGVDRSHRDLLLALAGEDPADLVDPLLIRLLCAYLDEGVAHWTDHARSGAGALALLPWHGAGGLAARRPGLRGARRGAPPPRRGRPVAARALDELGVAEARWEGYATRVLLDLPGWAGMIHRLEHTPSDRPAGAPPASLLEYLAVRLTLARHALRDVARRRLGYEGAPRRARRARPARRAAAGVAAALARPHAAVPPVPARPARRPLGRRDRAALDGGARLGARGLDEVARRRALHEAYERHHRVEVLHGIAANLRRPEEDRAVTEPRFQVAFCIDDRCEGLRRHVEELSPRHETFGVAAFFGVPIRYRGLDDAGHVSLCPVGVEPAHEIVERPHEEEAARRRKARRKRWARLLHALGRGSRTMARGMLLTPTLGLLSTVPLVGRILFLRAAARLRRALERRLLPAVPTRLHSPRDEGSPAAGEGRPFTAEDRAARVAATLENMGLTRGFAPIVAVLGHGSTSVNNPHQSAYDCGACGACGGRHGGPNARLFAALANDPEVRALLAARGIDIPDGAFFVDARDRALHGRRLRAVRSPGPPLAGGPALRRLVRREVRLRPACARPRRVHAAPRHAI
ncbi:MULTISPECIES: putative inorganic carbon transporter subunit DabA [Sorangium]|uniref:putative inorganic carbon transporter subunit DabA n=1 Tax=Sorangium TaxID=39643 RepID=UPI003D9C37D5